MRHSIYKILSLSAFILLICNGFANDNAKLLKEANEAYQQENYNDAISLYEQVVNNKVEQSGLYYNLGNAYYKAGYNAKALLWYERALRLDPSDEDTQHNIAFVNQKITDRIDAVPETAFARWWNRLSGHYTERGWAIWAIVGSFLLVASILCYLFSGNKILQISGFAFFWVALFLIVFSLIFANKEKNRYEQTSEAIIMNLVVEAKTAPSEKSRTTFVIHEGLKVQITNEINGYVEIRIPNGEKGWITRNTIEKI